jgi:hypothetical protein
MQAAGQFNFMSVSTDLRTWAAPEIAFSAAGRATNPIPCGLSTCVQWQPNLFMLANGSLGCVWSGSNGVGGRVDSRGGGTYLSVLDDPHGKWTNQLITFGGSSHPTALGRNWTLFASQNPFTLRSGRILAPVVMTDLSNAIAPDAPPGCTNGTFNLCTRRRSSVIFSDDLGATWVCGTGTEIPGFSWANWEPTVWQNVASDTVYMISRFNDFRTVAAHGPASDVKMQWSTSDTAGATWTSLEAVPVDTVVSRAEVMPQHDSNGSTVRWLMVQNDWNPGDITGTAGRLNTALWLAPAAGTATAVGAAAAFAPGIGLSPPELPAFYPQMWQSNATLAVSWSLGTSPRSIQVARLSLPPPHNRVLSVRNNTNTLLSPRPTDGVAWASFYGTQSLVSSRALQFAPGDRQFSVGVWAKLGASGGGQGLIDARSSADGGFLVGLHNTYPFLFLGLNASIGGTDNIEPRLGSALSNFSYDTVYAGEWLYIGLSVDTTAGLAQFMLASGGSGLVVTEDVPFHPRPHSQNLSSSPYNATVGNRNSPPETHSSVGGLSGLLGVLAVIPSMWTTAEHVAFANSTGVALGTAPIVWPPRPPSHSKAAPRIRQHEEPLLLFNGSNKTAIARDFPTPVRCRATSQPVVANQSLLTLCGQYSASVELPSVSCSSSGPGLRLTARVMLLTPDDRTDSVPRCSAGAPARWTVLTLGDAVAHTRLVAEWSESGGLVAHLHCSLDNSTVLVPNLTSKSALNRWTTLNLNFGATGSTTMPGLTVPFQCGCTMGGVWAFLGEGYLGRDYVDATDCVVHDSAALAATQL